MNFWPFRSAPRSLSLTDAIKETARDPHDRDCGIRTRGICDCGYVNMYGGPDPDWKPAALALPVGLDATLANKQAREALVMKGAERHAFHSQQLEAAGDEYEARLHLGDAAEYLSQIGGPSRVQSAEEVYQFCAARRASER